jgi:hypothetical protein
MSKIVGKAPNYNGVPVTLHVVLSDSSVFLDHGHWFKLLQDDGKEMSPEEILIYQEPTTEKPKKKYRTIGGGGEGDGGSCGGSGGVGGSNSSSRGSGPHFY